MRIGLSTSSKRLDGVMLGSLSQKNIPVQPSETWNDLDWEPLWKSVVNLSRTPAGARLLSGSSTLHSVTEVKRWHDAIEEVRLLRSGSAAMTDAASAAAATASAPSGSTARSASRGSGNWRGSNTGSGGSGGEERGLQLDGIGDVIPIVDRWCFVIPIVDRWCFVLLRILSLRMKRLTIQKAALWHGSRTPGARTASIKYGMFWLWH